MRDPLLPHALVTSISLAAALGLGAPAFAVDAFDYAVETFQVSGSVSFLDGFDDGQRDVAPSSELVERGTTVVSESGGRLHLRSADGAAGLAFSLGGRPSSTMLRDTVLLDRAIFASAGDATVAGTFRADIPSATNGCYGIFVENVTAGEGAYVSLCREDAVSFSSPSGCRVAGRPVLLLQRFDFTILSCVSVDPAAIQGDIVLTLKVETGAKTATARFSLDGGVSFADLPTPAPVFTAADRLYPGLLGQGGAYDGIAGFAPSAGLVGGTELSGVTGDARPLLLGTGAPDFASLDVGSFSLASAEKDLRLTPSTASISMPSGTLGAAAVTTRSLRRVDPDSGRPVSPDAPPGATCTTGAEPACVVDPAAPAANRAAYDAICDLTRGYSGLDRASCALDIYRSRVIPVVNLDLAAIFGLILAGGPTGIVLVSNPVFVGNASRIPVVALSIDPGDGVATGPFAFSANSPAIDFSIAGFNGIQNRHNGFQTLTRVLSPQQQALLGCGAFHGTACDTSGAQLGGMDLFHAEAGALLQSFAPSDDGFRTDDAGIAQPGTVGSTAPEFCDRDGRGGVVKLPGCRAPEDRGFSSVDGADPRSASIGFPAGIRGVPALGSPSLGRIAFTQGHPFTGQRWRSELAALSWNLQMFLVAGSAQIGALGFDARNLFDPANAFRSDGCSYVKPQLCTAVIGFLLGAGVTLPGDPTGRPLLRWAWESGAQYSVTSATGRFARYANGTLHAFGPGAIVSTQPEVAGYAAAVGFVPTIVAQGDRDGDLFIDVRDRCPDVADQGQEDRDEDNVGDACDNCLKVANTNQRDTDADGYGNICDPDLDQNGVVNFGDLALMKKVFFKASADADLDGDGLVNFTDLAHMKKRFFAAPGPSALHR